MRQRYRRLTNRGRAWPILATSLLTALGMVTQVGPAKAQAWERVAKNLPTEDVYWRRLSLSPGHEHHFRVSPDAGVDPVLVVYDDDFNVVAREEGAAAITIDLREAQEAAEYNLLVHAQSAEAGGLGNFLIWKDGERARIYRDIPVSGALREVPCKTINRYDLVLATGGASDPLLFGFDKDGVFLAASNDDGVSTGARLEGQFCKVLVARTASSTEGSVHLYINDFDTDSDGDKLGASFEAALGTCDSIQTTLSNCSGVLQPSDTDLDGLSDTVEVYGLDTDPGQTFPLWGANPLHKDIFLEVDFLDGSVTSGTQVKASDIREAQGYLAELPADHLGNPDGLPGVNLHADIGIPAETADELTLYGDWGGADTWACTGSANDCSKTGRNKNMPDGRKGRFIYGLNTRSGGGGKGAAGRFYFGSTGRLFVHEFSHAFGLGHGGHEKMGCKPNYPSILNYAFLDVAGVGYYIGGLPHQLKNKGDEAAWEQVDTSYFADSKFDTYLSPAGSPDWNRDAKFPSLYDGAPPRAPLRLADTDKSGGGCSQLASKYDVVKRAGLLNRRPAVVRAGMRGMNDDKSSTLVFFVSDNGEIHFRGQRLEGSDQGDAANLRPEKAIPDSRGARGLNATLLRDACDTDPRQTPCPQRVAVVARMKDDSLRLFVSKLGETVDDGGYGVAGEDGVKHEWQQVVLPAESRKRPDIIQFSGPGDYGQGAGSLAVSYVHKRSRTYQWLFYGPEDLDSFDDPTKWTNEPFVDENGNEVEASVGTAMTSVTLDDPASQFPEYHLVGAFTDLDSKMHIHTYDVEGQFWRRRFSLPTDEQAASAPTIAWGIERAYGQEQSIDAPDTNYGRLYIGWETIATSKHPSYPRIRITSPVQLNELLSDSSSSIPGVSSSLVNIWAYSDTGLDFFRDEWTLGLRVAYRTNDEVVFSAVADGTGGGWMNVYSDAKVMSRSICANVKGDTDSAKASCRTDKNEDYYKN